MWRVLYLRCQEAIGNNKGLQEQDYQHAWTQQED